MGTVVASVSMKKSWKIGNFRNIEDTQATTKMVCGGDVIRIYHFDMQSFLVGRPNDFEIRNHDNPSNEIINNL